MTLVIGVTACTRMVDETTDIHHVVFRSYTDYVSNQLGCAPLVIPAMHSSAPKGDVKSVIDRLDGLLLTGSPSNVGLRLKGDHFYQVETKGPLDLQRDRSSLALISEAYNAQLPVLGICRGCQEINVAFGGDLHQSVDELGGSIRHCAIKASNYKEKYNPRHTVSLSDRGWVRSIVPKLARRSKIAVNSLHRQAISHLGDGLEIEATASDGVVEAIKHRQHPFIMGVQWHLEWNTSSIDRYISEAFKRSCGDFNSRKEK